MAEIRVSGTKNLTQIGPTTISSPTGNINLASTLTQVTGDLNVVNTATILGNIDVRGNFSTVIIKPNDDNVDNINGLEYSISDIYGTPEQRQLGAVYVGGGVGIEKDLNVGGYIYGRVSQASTSLQVLVTSTNIDATYYPIFSKLPNGSALLFTDNTGDVGGLTYNPYSGKLSLDKLYVASTEPSTSPTTGAFTVTGGVGILGDVFLGSNLNVDGNINPLTDNSYAIGSTSSQWAEAYLENIYTKVISSVSGNVQINPNSGVTEVIGDLRVLGNKPIGTAPVVTNVLYVTVDGNDTNDGRAMDSSRACRTINGAVNSPYFQPGTQIRVLPGHYLEDNPVRLKPYTSIMGSDIRTTFIEPINKTQDLFHVESGCYIAFATFLNGRSGLLEGPYAQGFNRGAYATAFPPLPEGQRIDLFHSPYIQNCTNLSGPWLKDGTMYVPNQTVQVPTAVGTGTWVANTTTLIISASTGTITRGMSINAGQQNPGFFNARTLMLANKPFVQEQVVKYINNQVTANIANTSSVWYNFEYSQEKCFRDVGILVENIAYDAAFGGNQKAVESGLAYYNGVVSLIAGQEIQTTAAIDYLNTLTNNIIVNNTCTDLYAVGTLTNAVYSQVINWVLTGGAVAAPSINTLVDTITTIINDGPESAPDVYTSTGPDAAYVSAEILMQANRAFIQEDTINWINNTFLTFPYSEMKCRRDTGLIIDSIAIDMKYPTAYQSQSTFAGLQYWNQDSYVPTIVDELTTTTAAVVYLKDLSTKIIQNITPADDLIPRYQTSVSQNISLEPATLEEVDIINGNFDVILEIFNGNKLGWTDRIIPNGPVSNLLGVKNAFNLLQANTTYMAAEVNAYIATTYPTFVYTTSTCARDVGYMVNAVAFDLLHSGNRQSVQTGLYYYGFTNTSTIHNQESQTISAFNVLANLASNVVRNIPVVPRQYLVPQVFTYSTATVTETSLLTASMNTITSIIQNGPSVAAINQGVLFTATVSTNVLTAYDNLYANKNFLVEEVIAYIDQTYNPTSFNYDETKCYRDIGLIVDAISQDILLGGNQKSVEAGVSYWSAGYNYVSGQETTTTMAINYARDISLQIIANTPVTPQTSTNLTQVINPFFQYGGDYMPQQAVSRNFGIITNIIERGPLYAPPVYLGGGLFSLTGLNGADVKIAPKVTSVTTVSNGVYLIGLNTATIGFGNNATLYFGDTTVFPFQDAEVEELSLEYTNNASTWNSRKVDPIGSMGGSLVDGAVISARSPIQSFVYDAYTQLTQGGRGVHVTNDGYAQLVSVFTIFSSVGVQTDNGGIASIVNSNANFGDICLLAKGYGKRKFTGTLYNPAFTAFNRTTGALDPEYNQYYPDGFWPKGAQVDVFLPDTDDRPHISLIMEVEPPEGHVNEQLLPGFLNAAPNKATLTTGSIVISDIDTEGIAIGDSIHIRDQNNNRNYVSTGTIVTDLGYRSVTLSNALIGGGGDPDNSNFFDLYFCGNAYYTVISSIVAVNPKPEGVNILSTASTGLSVSQVEPHADTINYLNSLTNKVINNITITPNALNTTTVQTILPLVTGGGQSQVFVDLRFGEIVSILTAPNINSAEAVIPKRLRTKTGTVPLGAGSAVTLITENIEFLADEITAYVENTYFSGIFSGFTEANKAFIREKCQRDTKIILQRVIYDLESGGRYNSVMTGLSYWSRTGTHHLVQLGETVRRTDLFPDGASVNFYQRSYMSASGYVFEYVGAGSNYGALPQVGRADPVQGKETVQLDGGKVFFTSTDQNGDFRIGPGLVISQATGVLSGRTFTKSLFANMTPFILAIEGGG